MVAISDMWGTQYAKLKTNLKLAVNRLKLLQKKKTEMAMKARTEIVAYIQDDKPDRARIRVEAIIRDDFVVEAYELLEMYCELLHTRFGVIQQMKEPDDGIAEAVISLLWVAPRIAHEVEEFKVISDQLTHKYGKPFAEAARMNQLTEPAKVSPKLLQKLGISSPSPVLVEKYLIEICRCANVPFTPDPKIMRDDDDEIALAQRNLAAFDDLDVGPPPPPSGGGGGGGIGLGLGGGVGIGIGQTGPAAPQGDGIGWALPGSDATPAVPSILDQLPALPTDTISGNKGPGNNGSGGGGGTAAPFNYPLPTQPAPQLPPPVIPTSGDSTPPSALYQVPKQVPSPSPSPPVQQHHYQPPPPAAAAPTQSQQHYQPPYSQQYPNIHAQAQAPAAPQVHQHQHAGPHPDCRAPHLPTFAPPAPQGGYAAPYLHDGQGRPVSSAPSADDHIYEMPPNTYDFNFPEPPNDHVPVSGPRSGIGNDVDDLARRFEELKKRT
uniref:IST1 homolog n=1 Tax=Panagrellus redivivus TaxID=6233 RepID=A0A7E4V9B1_PANRE